MKGTKNQTMTSPQPYLLRAFYDWIADNGMTPYLMVNAEGRGVQVPQGYVEDGKIVLNLSPSAVQGLDLGNEAVAFSARFGGRPMSLYIPMEAVTAIYAQENGQGMMFAEEQSGKPAPEGEPPSSSQGSGLRPSGPPSLKVVK